MNEPLDTIILHKTRFSAAVYLHNTVRNMLHLKNSQNCCAVCYGYSNENNALNMSPDILNILLLYTMTAFTQNHQKVSAYDRKARKPVHPHRRTYSETRPNVIARCVKNIPNYPYTRAPRK